MMNANAARLYETPQEFAEMMIGHLSEGVREKLRQVPGEPLLLIGSTVKNGKEEDIFQISLHNTYQTYMNSGNLNVALDYLNSIIHIASVTQHKEENVKLDLAYLYPALREARYVEEAAADDTLYDDSLPGLKVVYLEVNEGFSKIINKSALAHHPGLTEERVRRIAYRNLRSESWTPPKLSLSVPSRETCIVDVYMDNPVPIECQFLNPELAAEFMPESYLIAFPNRDVMLVMHTSERMDTADQAERLANQSQFAEVVRRSHFAMRSPNCLNIYWSYQGTYTLLDIWQ